jgi:tyrosine aminotransferase
MSSSAPDAKRAKTWHIPSSVKAKRTHNPIRKIVDQIDLSKKNPDKEFIPLSLGDPCAFGNLFAPDILVEEMVQSVRSTKNNGYINSAGAVPARKAVAEFMSVKEEGVVYKPEDVVIASGCSGALEVCLTGLLDEGTNLLVPNPGFCLYQVIAEAHGAGVKFYNLKAENNWEADLQDMEAQIDDNTRAILVNNPSNPCGSVYSKEHLLAIIDIAERHHIPIVADEIYGNLCFEGHKMYPMASLTKKVPVLTAGGIAKEFIVPGWRVGWFTIWDPIEALGEVRKGFTSLTQITIGANAIVQGALPAVLTPVEGSRAEAELTKFRKQYLGVLQTNAMFTAKRFQQIPGLVTVTPAGAMYTMVGIDTDKLDIQSDTEFVEKLLTEEAVMVLPGQCFGMKNFFRVVLSPPMPKLEEAFSRIEAFCKRHAK